MRTMRNLASIFMALALTVGPWLGWLYGANPWILLPAAIVSYGSGLAMILFTTPLVVFCFTVVLAVCYIPIFGIDCATAVWSIGLAVILLSIQYLFWLTEKVPDDE